MRSEARTGDEEVQVIVDRDSVSQLGLTTEDVALTVAGAMRGDRLPELRTSDREITMRLAFRESDRQSVEDLAACRLRCRTARGWSSAPWPTSSCARATARSSASTG